MDKRQSILKAARQVIAREGFHGATIQKIAEEAGLKSPSLVYWYFKSKRELYQAMMEEMSPILSRMPDLWNRLDDPPEEVFLAVGLAYLRTFDNPETRQLLRIFFSELTTSQDLATGFGEKAVLLLNFLIAYLERQIELRRLRFHHTQSAARAFIGAFVVYMLGRELFLPLRAGLPEAEEYAREVVEIFMNGLRPV